jgi:ribosome-associated protein
MEKIPSTYRNFKSEFSFSTSRSSGPGGQNVNKVNTKVELRFNVEQSLQLSDLEKHKIKSKLKNRINSDGELIVISQDSRSQLKNKEDATDKFYQLIAMALKPVKKRKASKPSRSAIEKRLKMKEIKSKKKELRRRPDL